MRTRAAAALLVVLLAACSSTSDDGVDVDRPDGPTTADAVASPGATSEAAEAGAAAADPSGPSAGSGRGRASSPRSSASAAARGGAPSGVVPRGGTVKIGVHYSENLDTAYRALGASGSFVNIVNAIRGIVDDINRRGGMGGRKVELVLHGTDPLNGSFPDQAERACTFFTEDAKVFAVVSGAVLPDENMAACFAKHKTPLVWEYQYLLDRPALDRYAPTLYMPQTVGVDRFGFYVPALAGAGFFEPGARVGIVRYDQPIHKRFADTMLRPALKARGIVVADEAIIGQPRSAGQASEGAAQINGAILRFRSSQVSHVIFVPTGGAVPWIWGTSADSQGYRPRYAMTSLDIPTFVTDNVSDEQLDGAVAVGWMPTGDTYLPHVPKDPDLERCFKGAGVRSGQPVRFCDGLFFLKQVLDREPRFSPAGLRSAAEGIGDRFATPYTFRSLTRPGRHDGASAYRIMRFTPACSCFRYSGGDRPIP